MSKFNVVNIGNYRQALVKNGSLAFRLGAKPKSSMQREFHSKQLAASCVIVSHQKALAVLKVMLLEIHAANVQKYLDNV